MKLNSTSHYNKLSLLFLFAFTYPLNFVLGESVDFRNYQKWTESYFDEQSFINHQDPLADPDGDGYSNKFEYIFAMNPTLRDSKWYSELILSNHSFEIIYPLASQSNDVASFSISGTTSLESPFSINHLITATISTGNQYEPSQVKSIFTSNSEKAFVKIDAVQVRYKSPKRGLGLSNKLSADWDEILPLINPSWHYSWSASLLENHPTGLEFVPQFWGKNSISLETIQALKPHIESGKIKYLIGFNEPDLESQANMTVAEAIQKWSELEQLLKSEDLYDKVALVSPVVAHDYSNWLIPFLNQAFTLGFKIDYLAIHRYTQNNDPDAFLDNLNDLYMSLESYGKKIWLKEFSVRSIGNETNTPENVLAFMQVVLPALESYDWIYRYAWFSARKDSTYFNRQEDSILFDSDNLEITPLGTYYKSIEAWY